MHNDGSFQSYTFIVMRFVELSKALHLFSKLNETRKSYGTNRTNWSRFTFSKFDLKDQSLHRIFTVKNSKFTNKKLSYSRSGSRLFNYTTKILFKHVQILHSPCTQTTLCNFNTHPVSASFCAH